MPLRFRKSISLAKGVRLNFGKRGASLSLGGKGLSVNLSDRGAKTTIGLPGTGLSYTTTRVGELHHKHDERGEKIDVQTDAYDIQTSRGNEQPDKFNRQPNEVDNLVDGFQYSDESPSNLNLFFTTMTLVFIGGLAVLGLLYLLYYVFLLP